MTTIFTKITKIGLVALSVLGLGIWANSDVSAQSMLLSGGRSPYRYYCSEQLNLYVQSAPSAFASVDSYIYLNTGDLNYTLANIWTRNNPPYALQVNGPVFAFDAASNILLKLGVSKGGATTQTGLVGTYNFTNNTGVNSTYIDMYLRGAAGTVVGSNEPTVSGTGTYFFSKSPCIDDIEAPSVANIYTSGGVIPLAGGTTGITHTQGLEFTIYEATGSATPFMLSGGTNYTLGSVEYVANTISADNQRGVDLSGLTIQVQRNTTGNRTQIFSGSDFGTNVFVYPLGETWSRQDKHYRVVIPASSLQSYGVENQIQVTLNYGDRAGISQSGGNVKPLSNEVTNQNFTFNASDNPAIQGVYPANDQPHIRLTVRGITVRLTDGRAGINTGTLSFTISGSGYSGNSVVYSGSDLTIVGSANDMEVTFTGLYDYPIGTTMTVTVSGYDLADAPNPFLPNSYQFQTRNACFTYDCNEPIRIKLGASAPTWIELDPTYTNLIITGGNNPTYSGLFNGDGTGYIMCNLTGYTRSGTYIYSGLVGTSNLLYFNDIYNTGKQLFFSGADTTRIHLSGDLATVYRALSGYLSYVPANGCSNFVTSGTNTPVSVLLNLTGTSSYATGFTPEWSDLGNGYYITTTTGNSTAATHFRVINFENIYSDTGSLSTTITCMDLINPVVTGSYLPPFPTRTSGTIDFNLSGINVSTGLFDDEGITRVYLITGNSSAPTAFDTNTSLYSGTHTITFTGNWSGYVYYRDRALNASGQENGNTGVIYVQVDRYDNIAPRDLSGTYVAPFPGPTNQDVTLTLTGYNTGDAFTLAYTGDDEFIYVGYTGTANVPTFLSAPSGVYSLMQPFVFTQNRSGTILLSDRAGNTTGFYVDVSWIDKVRPYILTSSYITIGGTGNGTNGYPGAGYSYAPVLPGWSLRTSGNVQLVLTGNEPIQLISIAGSSFPPGISILDNTGRTVTGNTRIVTFTGNYSGYILFDDEATNTGDTYLTGGDPYSDLFLFDIFWIDRVEPSASTGIYTGTIVGVQIQNKFLTLTGNTGGDANYITDDEYLITSFSGSGQPFLSGFTISGDSYSMDKLLDFRDNRSGTIFITDRAGNTTGIYVDVNGISTAIEYTIIAYSQNRGPNNYDLTGRLYIYQTSNQYYDRLPITLGSGGTGSFTYNLANASWKLVFEGSAHLRLGHFDIPITGGQTVVDFSTGDTLTGNFQTNPEALLISNGVVFLRAGDVVKGAGETNGRNYINAPDLDAMLEQSTLGVAGDPHFDINRDGTVNSADTTILINNYFVEGFGYARGLTY